MFSGDMTLGSLEFSSPRGTVDKKIGLATGHNTRQKMDIKVQLTRALFVPRGSVVAAAASPASGAGVGTGLATAMEAAMAEMMMVKTVVTCILIVLFVW